MDSSFTLAGVIFMTLSWSAIIALLVFSFSKILGEKEEKIVGVPEVEAEIDEDAKRGNNS